MDSTSESFALKPDNRPDGLPGDYVKFRFEVPREWVLHASNAEMSYFSSLFKCYGSLSVHSNAARHTTVYSGYIHRDQLALLGPLVEDMWRRSYP